MNNILSNSKPLVTIGIPFKNNETVLEQAILSVLHQTFQNWELLLMDDNSSDHSTKIAEKYLYDDRIKLYVDHQNIGLPGRLNKMIDLAQGLFFCRMDGDDIMHPNRIEKQVAILSHDSEIDVVGSSAILIDESSNIVGIRKVASSPNKILSVVMHGLFIHPTVMGRTQWFRANKYRKEFVLTEDLELWLRTYGKSKFVQIDNPLLFYRLPTRNSIKKYKTTTLNTFKIINKYFIKSNSLTRAFLYSYFSFKLAVAYLINLTSLDRLWLRKSSFGNTTNDYTKYKGSLDQAICHE